MVVLADLDQELANREQGITVADLDAELLSRQPQTEPVVIGGKTFAPGTTPEIASRIPPEFVFDPSTGGYVDTALIARRGPTGEGALATAIAGVPFVGEFAEEVIGALSGLTGGLPADIATETLRQARQQFREERPGTATALEIGGGIVGSLPAAAALPSLAALAPAGLIPQVAAGVAAGAGGGAIEGAVSGFGAGTGETRGESAVERGILGGVFGGALGGLAPAAAAGIRNLLTRTVRKPVAEAAKDLGVSEDVVNTLRSTIDLEDAQRAGTLDLPESMLADAGPETEAILDFALQAGGRGTRASRVAIEDRAVQAGARANTVLDQTLGAPQGRGASRGVARGARGKEVSDLYNAAYRTPIDYSAPEGAAIQDLIARLPNNQTATAINSANDRMKFEGIPEQIIASIGEDGVVTFSKPPNVIQLDYIKRAFDQMKREGTDPLTGKLTPDASFAGQIARDVRDATANAVPAYREALDAASDVLGQEAAVETGYGLLRAGVTREVGRNSVAGMTGAEKRAAMQGAREFIDDTLANIRRTVTDPNIEARQAQKLIGDLSSPASRSKLTSLVGQKQAGMIFEELDRTAIAMNLRSAVTRNSATFARMTQKEVVERLTAPGPLDELMRGSPAEATKKLVQSMTASTDEAIANRQQGLYADIAEALTNIQGDDAKRALRILSKVNFDERISSARAQNISRAVAAGLAVPAQQQATREAAR